jgi:hypothetical protein
MIQAVAAVAGRERPSLGKVVRYLEASSDPASKNLGAVLHSMSEMRLARLCFSPTAGQRIDAEGWTTVFTLAGLTLPDASVRRDDFSYEQRLSVALLYLVSQFSRRLLNEMDRRTPKAIFLDEAWAITSTPEGAKLVPEVSRMGRSRNTALILVSQNAGDLLSEQVTNCISSVFAFRSSERVEVANVMALLGVEPSADHQAVLRGLGNGECIFRDMEGRAGRIGIDLITEEMRRWLDTNPTRSRPAPAAGAAPQPAAPEPAAHANADPAPAPPVRPGAGLASEPTGQVNTGTPPAQPGVGSHGGYGLNARHARGELAHGEEMPGLPPPMAGASGAVPSAGEAGQTAPSAEHARENQPPGGRAPETESPGDAARRMPPLGGEALPIQPPAGGPAH